VKEEKIEEKKQEVEVIQPLKNPENIGKFSM
jgi:hypothetical protein